MHARRAKMLKLLSGEGIEIGALHCPVRAPHLDIRYVDRFSVEELRKQYPELERARIVKTDIIADAEHLEGIADESQDFVIANHVIEHMRDPIRSLLVWQRVLKPGGRLYLAAPDRNVTFDSTRPLTTIAHLIEDYEDPSRERDFEAFVEFAREVSCRVFNVRPIEEAEALAHELAEKDYSIHFHVWDDASFEEFLEYLMKHFEQFLLRPVGHRPTRAEEFIWVLEKVNSARCKDADATSC
jgi:SAM-dependent methyltransferase